jgi:type IV secretory pathway VirB10-like protein
MNSYNAIFNTNFPQSPSNLVLPLDETEVPVKRGRGRPKGSKNKPKPGAPPPAPPPPKRKRGRPPKIRTEEELAEMQRRQQEKELGIQRKRGRPRKYPGIGLVREMRLKKNRAMFAEKIRQQEEEQKREAGEEYEYKEDEYEAPIDVALGQQVAAAVARQPVQDGGEYWSYQDGQSLLDVVGSSLGVEGSSGVGGIGADIMSGDQSDEMRGVFTLPDVPEVQQ